MPPKKSIPQNTATLEYFGGKVSTEISSADDIESWPSSASSSPKPPSSSSPKPTAGAGAEQSPSPTPSDIVLAAHLDDTLALGEENRRMAERGVEIGKRKRVLMEMEKEREDQRNRKKDEEGKKMHEEEQESIDMHEEGKKGK
jgi:hypothetical protein